ncbi:hypothetical protein SETIT_8G025300v2 [Setaria italica]|uniref:Uncharacterized protein n=1 Tax=Setaria italica TaxID=4555 RepID=A0A368S3Q3_SETIT|nr:hypothetical protein SETIT_8G025300v2 [Setaria italica]
MSATGQPHRRTTSLHSPSSDVPAAAENLRRGANDGGVLAAIRAELSHELASSTPSAPPSFHSQDAPDFVAVSDAPRVQDVLLHRRDDSEEVLVSALLSPPIFMGRVLMTRAALMKVFVSKPSATPVLRFDCGTHWVEEEGGDADYAIHAVRYHPIPGEAGEDKYERPEFRSSVRLWCSALV